MCAIWLLLTVRDTGLCAKCTVVFSGVVRAATTAGAGAAGVLAGVPNTDAPTNSGIAGGVAAFVAIGTACAVCGVIGERIATTVLVGETAPPVMAA